MTEQLVFIDDSGDPGFRKGASPNLIMAAAVFADAGVANELSREISTYRKSMGWKEQAEFKFRKTNKKIIKELLLRATKYDFKVYAVYIDKTKYRQSPRELNNVKLYNWAVERLLEIMPLKHAFVKLDGSVSKEYDLKVRTFLRQSINKDARKIAKFRIEDSTKENLIQLADILAGAINRFLQEDKADAADYYNIFKKKVVKLVELELE